MTQARVTMFSSNSQIESKSPHSLNRTWTNSKLPAASSGKPYSGLVLILQGSSVRIVGIHNTQLPQKLLETFLLSTEGKLKDLLFLGGFCKVPLKPANAPKRQQVGNALPLYCPWEQHVWLSASCFSLAASPFTRNLQTSEALAAVATLQSFHFLNKALLVTLSRGFVCSTVVRRI